MEVELEPGQPPEVSRAVAELLAPARHPSTPVPVDPWWRAGLLEALEPDSRAT
jgi:hypothetical protein